MYHTAERILTEFRHSSSLPVLAETRGGVRCVIKWKGTGEGPLANAVDWISLQIARTLGIPVPRPLLVGVEPDLARQTQDGELRDLIRRSVGVNLGVEFIEGAMPYHEQDVERIPPRLRDMIFAFDVLFLNIDRTDLNPNMIFAGRRLYCIDMSATQAVKALLSGRHCQEHALLPLLRRHPFFTPSPGISLPTVVPGLGDALLPLPEEWLPDGNARSRRPSSGIAEILSDSRSILERRLAALKTLPLESHKAMHERALRNRKAFEEKFGRL